MFRKRRGAARLSRTRTPLFRRRMIDPWRRARTRFQFNAALLLGILFVWWWFRRRDTDYADHSSEHQEISQTAYPYSSYQRQASVPLGQQTPAVPPVEADA